MNVNPSRRIFKCLRFSSSRRYRSDLSLPRAWTHPDRLAWILTRLDRLTHPSSLVHFTLVSENLHVATHIVVTRTPVLLLLTPRRRRRRARTRVHLSAFSRVPRASNSAMSIHVASSAPSEVYTVRVPRRSYLHGYGAPFFISFSLSLSFSRYVQLKLPLASFLYLLRRVACCCEPPSLTRNAKNAPRGC